MPTAFYAQPTLKVAQSLIGKYLVRQTPDERLEGRIVETEAYVGPEDRASHASRGRTKRTDVMFGPPGLSYVYLIYGMHHCFNVVTEYTDYPAAVLIRAVEHKSRLVDGPGRVCRLFDIDRTFNRHDLTNGQHLWIEDRELRIRRDLIIDAFPRIGVDYAGAWAAKPWRFRMRRDSRP